MQGAATNPGGFAASLYLNQTFTLCFSFFSKTFKDDLGNYNIGL